MQQILGTNKLESEIWSVTHVSIMKYCILHIMDMVHHAYEVMFLLWSS